MEWFTLALAGLMYSYCAYLSYNDVMRNTWYYVPLCVFMGTVLSMVWFGMCWYLDDKHKIYVYSLCWDVVMAGVYYIFPVLFLGVKLDRWSLCGLFLILLGVAIIKLRAS